MAVPSISRKEVERDDFLRYLAAYPGEALRRWGKLRKGEDTIVVQYMAMFYGLDFTTTFRQLTLKHARPDNLVIVTNIQSDPKLMSAKGYKFVGTRVDVSIWRHPSGREIWVLPKSKMTTVVQPIEEHPSVTEARNDADDQTTAKNRIVQEIMQVRANANRPGYSALYKKMIQDFNGWQNQLNELIENRLPQLSDEVQDAPEKAAVAEQAKRLDDLMRWKTNEFPALIQGLPTPDM
jgi:hypothetical protein